MNTPEQQASEMLVLGVALSEKDMQALHDWAIKLRQPIIAERDALKAELAAIKQGAPSNRPAVPLTDEQIDALLERERQRWSSRTGPPTYEFALAFARAIEAAHGIKGA